jgi:cell volume regulation protein A
MPSIELLFVALAAFLLAAILGSKVATRTGAPVLLLFLFLGMLAGSDGVGGFYFDNPFLAQSVGVVALASILFSGGLNTPWQDVRPVLKQGLALSTLGVTLTALCVGWFISPTPC